MVRLLIADDHTVVREGIKRILANAPDVVIVAEARDGLEALAEIKRGNCEIALLDISMPGMSGLDVLSQVKKEGTSGVRVILFSVHSDAHYAARALRDGAYGYLSKASGSDELLSAILAVSLGRKYVSQPVLDGLAGLLRAKSPALPHEALSRREYTVLCMLGAGMSIKSIAVQLSISRKTVETYRVRLLTKMGLKTNAELIRYVVENHLTA